MKNIPQYLKNYIIEQDYSQYSSTDHACWRFIMKLNKAYFSKHAHKKYLEGIKKTGITIEEIPKIININKKLEKFGWSAVGVKGFLPPLIFMEFQSKGILPIACDMRSIKHLTYTPAPDIVHEAAGHSPMIADFDYAEYLKYYGKIARKAIFSSEDYNLYIAIRKLSDIKENPKSTQLDIKRLEDDLKDTINSISYISEAAYLSRINWWTVEYGLVGEIDYPKIYGAGLLSSIGESENCLKDNVKKIPLSIDCMNYSYDITEQQPQLFVAKSFKSLNKILDDFSLKMAYKIGGLEGINKAIQSKTICTIELDSGIQISGKVEKTLDHNLSYLQLGGPVQLCYSDKEIIGHGTDRHPKGFGFPLGQLLDGMQIHKINKDKLFLSGYKMGEHVEFKFKSGIIITGIIKTVLEKNNYIKIITLDKCKVMYHNQVLFDPAWGEYDMLCGEDVKSVFGGPADIDKYFDDNHEIDQINKLNSMISISSKNKRLNYIYSEIRKIRENGTYTIARLEELLNELSNNYPEDWLAKLEIYEIIHKEKFSQIKKLEELLNELSNNYPEDWLAKLEIYEIIHKEKFSQTKKLKEFLHLKASMKSDLSKAIKNSLQLIE